MYETKKREKREDDYKLTLGLDTKNKKVLRERQVGFYLNSTSTMSVQCDDT